MKPDIHYLKYFMLPFVLFVLIVMVTIFGQQSRDWFLPVLFLLLPFIDPLWRSPNISYKKHSYISWAILIVAITILLSLNPKVIDTFVVMLLVAALPEEWFFRAYFMQRIELMLKSQWGANVLTSLFFSLMHMPMQGWFGLAVFVPSLIFGWLYQQNRDLILVILVHAFFNGVFLIYIKNLLV